MKLGLLKTLRLFHLINKKDYNEKRQIEIVKHSPLFDKKWYLAQNPDVKAKKIGAAKHYVKYGWREGRNPSPHFNTQTYLAEFPELYDKNWCPLFHYYLRDGQHIKTPVFLDNVEFPKKCSPLVYNAHFDADKIKRLCIFASFSSAGIIEDYVIYYLKGLKKVCDAIIFIADNPIIPDEINKIKNLVVFAQFERHGEYDFGSYKRGYQYAKSKGLLRNCDEIIFSNDSCYGPIYPFKKMFNEMSKRNVDFWGITQNIEYDIHLQSYFLVFKSVVFKSNAFNKFINSINHQKNVQQVICNYETTLTRKMYKEGFTWDSYIKYNFEKAKYPYIFHPNLTRFPLFLLKNKCPLMKVKNLKLGTYSFESKKSTLEYINSINPKIATTITNVNMEESDISFSIVMPTYNRKYLISKAIDSLLNQTYQNFELIIVDDGSTDGTQRYLKQKYEKEIKSRRIKYFYKKNEGVCKARNYGLTQTNNEWICYLDSDNILCPTFLETFVNEILKHKNKKIFYAMFKSLTTGIAKGRKFDLNSLYLGNFIDLGTFCHHRCVYNKLGGFDEQMNRLVDWELAIRYTKKYKPIFIPKVVMLYNDNDDHARISNTNSYRQNKEYIKKKHHLKDRLLVHLHLFYHDQIDYFISKLKNITCDYDLVVTVCEKNAQSEAKLKALKSNVCIFKVANRGYDIYPFWQVLQKINLDNYDYVLKIHTKNFRNTTWYFQDLLYKGFEWRNALISPLIGAKQYFKRNIRLLDDNSKIGMLGSKKLLKEHEEPLQLNNTKKLCENFNINYKESKFVAGTMFIIRSELLNLFKNYKFKDEDFPSLSNTGEISTLAHSIETFFGILVSQQGYKTAGVDSFYTFCKRIKASYWYTQKRIKRKLYQDVDYIKHSKFFDGKWYLKQYPDIRLAKISPARHYLKFGWKEGRNPGPNFNTNSYLLKYDDIKRAKLNPLLHYEKYGKYEARQTCNLIFENKQQNISKPFNTLNYKSYDLVVGITVTTMITSYNHEKYIRQAIESAIKQTGNFNHEILISDDGSTDSTPLIIAEYAAKYPNLIKNISQKNNVGISANMKRCFEAASGQYIAVLEGDDYWTDHKKLEKQMEFLEKNNDCSMVFSRIKLLTPNQRLILLDRHNRLNNKLTGRDFCKELSLIVNFSCCMFISKYMKDLPDILYRYRLSEIPLVFYLEQKGKIGYIDTPLSVYRQHSNGVWTGADRRKQLEQKLIVRHTALAVCEDKYKKPLQQIIATLSK